MKHIFGFGAAQHSYLEDIVALLVGAMLAALGVQILKASHLLVGGVAGLAFLAHYVWHVPFGTAFFLINLPFFAMSARRMGWIFTVKALAGIATLSALSNLQPELLHIDAEFPAYAAIAGGLLLGVGFLIIFRHGFSAGGTSIVAMRLFQTRGLPVGRTLLVFDLMILLASAWSVGGASAAWSFIGVAALNMVIVMNFNAGRYLS